jgi:hypothetical protein
MSEDVIIPVEQKEHVSVLLTLEVIDCYHMTELLMTVSSSLANIQNSKVSMVSADAVLIDRKTGQPKYRDIQDDDEADIYQMTESGIVKNNENLIVFDPNEDL